VLDPALPSNLRHLPIVQSGEPRVERLDSRCGSTVLDFLSKRPAHTAYLAGLIHMNGFESPANRGDFYAYYDHKSELAGVALIGHAVTFEASTTAAVEALARHASQHPDTVLIRCERNKIDCFWRSYVEVGRRASTNCDEQLLELTIPYRTKESDYDLRPATPEELEQAVSMNVELALAERGNDPLKLDPVGFRQRLLGRILGKHVWVWVRHGKVIFKAEVITRTPDVVYLEGIYVHRDERGKGHGLRSMRQLGNILLSSTRSLCLFVNAGNCAAQAFYKKAGYRTVGHYETIYLQREPLLSRSAAS
jgi:GNAT superfamily N-acetyltransferase